MGLLNDLEIRAGLSVGQAADLLCLPAATYYQYRRTGKMPSAIVGYVQVMMRVDKKLLNALIAERVYANDL